MPLHKCTECHHEWEGDELLCDWCGAGGDIILEETQFEAFVKALFGDDDEPKT